VTIRSVRYVDTPRARAAAARGTRARALIAHVASLAVAAGLHQ
jgi:hypothetical protein